MTKSLIAIVLGAAALSAAPAKQTFRGVISDSMCAETHAAMRMGPTDADCTVLCVMAHGAAYVLVSGKTVYMLSDQRKPEMLAGQKVAVVGTLDAKTNTIQVASITAAR